MKIGPLYALWTRSWLGLMHRLVDLGRETERLRREVEMLRRRDIEPPAPAPSRHNLFAVLDGWVTHYHVDGAGSVGYMPLYEDESFRRQLAVAGGAAGKRVLELGPMEAAHTRVVCETGAREVVAVEGFRKSVLKCLVAKEVFGLTAAKFLYGDFCEFVRGYAGEPFDLVLARGVLYHQSNPAELIHGLGRLTETVLVWSQVADETRPAGGEVEITAAGRSYRGKVNDYLDERNTRPAYCGGVHPTAVWLYPDDLRRAFADAGFVHVREAPSGPTLHGPVVQFVASKQELPDEPGA